MASFPAALGLRAHSGWAALVAVAGSPWSPSVVDRRIIQLCNPKTRGSKQPYHAAEALTLKAAEKLVTTCLAETEQLAQEGLCSAIADLQKQGHKILGCGILLGSGRSLPTLDRILASHALIHAAEGEMFRNALRNAANNCGLPVTGIRERDLFARASVELNCSLEALRQQLAEMARSLGPPWREDQKCAMLAGSIALAASSNTASTAR